jgi:hypothetical protein
VHGTELFDHAENFGLYLPKDDWHYLWYSKDGNNDYSQRVRRARSLIKLATDLGIKVQEDNLFEGEDLGET